MHEVHLVQCNNSYSSSDCGQHLWPGPHPRQGSETGRGTKGSYLENARGDAEPRAGAPVSLSPPQGTRTAPGAPKLNLPHPSLARASLGGHVSPSGSKVRASCSSASGWEGCAGGGHRSGSQPCLAPVGRGEVAARQATPQQGAPGAPGRGGAGLGKHPGRAPPAPRGLCCWGEKRAQPRPEPVGAAPSAGKASELRRYPVDLNSHWGEGSPSS